MAIDSTKQRILLAAGPIFARKGFEKTTIREVSQAASVNLASINYYFGDKEKLYAETLLLAQQIRVKENPQPIFDQDTAASEKLHIFIRTLLQRIMAMQSEPWQLRLIMREVLQPTEGSKALINQYFIPFFESLLEIVDELVGVKLPHFHRQQLGVSIVGQCMIYRTSAEMMSSMLSSSETEFFNIESLAASISEFSLSALEGIARKHNLPLSETNQAF